VFEQHALLLSLDGGSTVPVAPLAVSLVVLPPVLVRDVVIISGCPTAVSTPRQPGGEFWGV